jgi:glutamate carboxypeptidase
MSRISVSMISVSDAAAHQEQLLSDLKALVEIESPSSDKRAIDHLAEFLAARLEHYGGNAQIHLVNEFGNHVQADFAGVSESKPVLLLGHVDTVWDIGTLDHMPFHVADGRVWGPGVLDMKGGIAIAIQAMALLREHDSPHPPVRMLFVSDEEIGSFSSRAITERLALDSQAVLVLEPGQGLEGAVKTSRKGIGVYEIKVTGQAAHAGVDPGKGASAIHELAHQIEVLSSFSDVERGITLNAGVIRGGTRSNVIAADAWTEVDVRVKSAADGKMIDEKLHSLRARDSLCKVQVTGGIRRPPMERSEKGVLLYRQAAKVAESLGLTIDELPTGGGSDGNFTAALGVPTLDGLGAVGEGAHAVNESVLLNQLAPRTALLAGLIGSL